MILAAILEAKRTEVARLRQAPSPNGPHAPGGGVNEALERPIGAPLRLVTEIKFKSPSAGPLSRVLSVEARALAYARGGAAMISVLCDAPFFDGAYDHLARARAALDAELGAARPRLLCKEFVIDPAQIALAAASGADAVLLIARIVPADVLASLAEHARTLGLEPLVEVATLGELDAARAAGARTVGVNARDLDTLTMDPTRSRAVLEAIHPGCVRLHLSGLGSGADVARLASGPADAALVGEALMRQADPAPLLAEMRLAAAQLAACRPEAGPREHE